MCGGERRKEVEEGRRRPGWSCWALAPMVGVSNETQWHTWPASGVFVKQKVLTQLKARFPPGRTGK